MGCLICPVPTGDRAVAEQEVAEQHRRGGEPHWKGKRRRHQGGNPVAAAVSFVAGHLTMAAELLVVHFEWRWWTPEGCMLCAGAL